MSTGLSRRQGKAFAVQPSSVHQWRAGFPRFLNDKRRKWWLDSAELSEQGWEVPQCWGEGIPLRSYLARLGGAASVGFSIISPWGDHPFSHRRPGFWGLKSQYISICLLDISPTGEGATGAKSLLLRATLSLLTPSLSLQPPGTEWDQIHPPRSLLSLQKAAQDVSEVFLAISSRQEEESGLVLSHSLGTNLDPPPSWPSGVRAMFGCGVTW